MMISISNGQKSSKDPHITRSTNPRKEVNALYAEDE